LVVQTLLGAGATVALAALTRGLGLRASQRAVVLGLLVADPVFYHFVFLYFQPIWELCLLLLSALALQRLLDRPTPGRASAFCVTLTILAYTRSLFHFVWIFGMLAAALVWIERHHAPGHDASMVRRIDGIRIGVGCPVLVVL